MNKIKKWWNSLSVMQKAWIIGSTSAITALGLISGDSWVNVLIGAVGMFYVSVYSTGARTSFLLGIVYVSLYTIICLKNRIMLDAVQNIVLIPLYAFSWWYWGKYQVKPKNLPEGKSAVILTSAVVVFVGLWGLSKLLHGNYSILDSMNTTCTLYAMVLGIYGISLNWCLWTINNVVSAIIFGLALMTPEGSATVFAMKLIFMVNGLVGWYNFRRMANKNG